MALEDSWRLGRIGQDGVRFKQKRH
jgi:hypothetical protein